jgi:hypothetical protein
VQVRRFTQGTLEVGVEYRGALPLPAVLQALPFPIAEIWHEEPYRIRVRLDADGDA